jgi:hypothetical protein
VPKKRMPAAERQQEPVDRKAGTSSGGVDGQLAGYRAWCSEPVKGADVGRWAFEVNVDADAGAEG